MANPQKENGYSPIANEILEAVYKCKFNGTQLRILLVVWRYTYGYSRKEHELSVSFISEATGITKRQIQKELTNLIEDNVLIVIREASFHTTRIIAFNKDYDRWKYYNSTPKEQQANNSTRDEQSDTSTGEQKDVSRDEQLDTQQNKKANINQISNSSSKEEPCNFYLQNIKRRGFTVSPFDRDLIIQLENQYGIDLLIAAMKVTAKKGADNIGYVEGVLTKWEEAGVKDIDQAREYERQFREKQQKKYTPKKQEQESYGRAIPDTFVFDINAGEGDKWK